MIKRSLFILFLILLYGSTVWAYDSNHVEGSGKIITEAREVSAFTMIELDGAFTTQITCQEQALLEITADDNIVPLIRTEVRDGKLFVSSEKSYSTRSVVRVTIGLQMLRTLGVSGANDVTVNKIKSGEFKVDASGSSTIILKGQAVTLSSEISGAATLLASELKAEEVSVNISGAGNAEVYASRKLNAQILGAGSVIYDGNPESVARNILGAGSIEPR